MTLDPNILFSVSYWVKGVGYAASGMSAALLTDFGSELDESHKVIRFFFRGNIRSLFTSELFLSVGLALASLIAPWNFFAIVSEGLIWGLGLIVVAPLFFMNVKIGPISWASRDRIRKIRIIGAYVENARLKKDRTLNFDGIKSIVSCMLRGALQGNKGSAKHLAELAKRDDVVGLHVRRAIVDLSGDLSVISTLLNMDFANFDSSFLSGWSDKKEISFIKNKSLRKQELQELLRYILKITIILSIAVLSIAGLLPVLVAGIWPNYSFLVFYCFRILPILWGIMALASLIVLITFWGLWGRNKNPDNTTGKNHS